MVQITADFGITGPVDFLDVHVERDNLLFIDPSAIRVAAWSGDKYGSMADGQLTHFFDEILSRLSSSKADERLKGEGDLQRFGELKQTRLGMSRVGTEGHGAAAELGTRIWSELVRNPLCQHAIATLKYIEDIPLFVDGIDKDLTSDITARIILATLLGFTEDMMSRHGEFFSKRATTDCSFEYWDVGRGAWVWRDVTLPTSDGKALILVPKIFVNYKIQMTYGQYYGVAVLDYIKSEKMVEVTVGKKKVLRPQFTKKALKEMPEFEVNRKNSTQQTARIFLDDGVDTLGSYRRARQSSFVALDANQLADYLSREP